MFQIKQYIGDNKLKPVDKLMNEYEMSNSLGISRNSVKKALKTKQVLGIIEAKPGDGVFLRPFNFDTILDNMSYGLTIDKPNIQELLDARKALEFYFIDDSSKKSKPNTITKLIEIIEKMHERAVDIEISDLDEEFHITLCEFVENKVFLKLIHVFWKVMNLLGYHNFSRETDLYVTYQNHKTILGYFVKGDVKGARNAIKDQFANIEKT